ncbi:hypothetical protein FHR81_005443 [Actinoalloteichus hoggarensis]|uniref:Uncharacterized protein n=1 Tax=Actinoalloteichus hoggarensis TaxID=1470176 RepID=A0A221VWS4_9PSEU|nr:hypothetical protein [Actinoalloteichus hoggarensis]ASO17954.1 hypothetical protein AHOG_01445 [Actinoalloteichus hoggarensis]MBB5924366.1 hypothetical protein [Actinoalloteichus hoggarensis]
MTTFMPTAPRLVVLPAVGACAVFGANLPGRGPTFLLDLGAVHVEMPIPADQRSRSAMADFLRTLAFASERASEWIEQTSGLSAGPVINHEPDSSPRRDPRGGMTSGYREVRGQWDEDAPPSGPGVLPSGRHAWPEDSDHPTGDPDEKGERGWWS